MSSIGKVFWITLFLRLTGRGLGAVALENEEEFHGTYMYVRSLMEV